MNRREFILSAGAMLLPAQAVQPQIVSAALVLAADISGSISEASWKLQREGYAYALMRREVLRAISLTRWSSIAVCYFEWSEANQQDLVIPWTFISTAENAEGIAETLVNVRNHPRRFNGSTSISGALTFGSLLFSTCPFNPDRQVIDVSGDGVNNAGIDVALARDAALAHGVDTINGLVIEPDVTSPGGSFPAQPNVMEHYRENVVGGLGPFVMAVEDFDSLAYAIVNKLVMEIA